MEKIETYSIYAMSGVLLVGICYHMFLDQENVWSSGMILVLAMLLIYGELFILPNEEKKKYVIGYSVLVVTMIWAWSFMSNSQVSLVFYWLIIFQIMRAKNIQVGYGVAVGIMVLVQIRFCLTLKDLNRALLYGLGSLSFTILALLLMTLLCYIWLQNKQLTAVKEELLYHNLDLIDANEQLKRAYHEIEEYTMMKERTQLSREMHDTVGHTLTTALVELELCKLLVTEEGELKTKLDEASQKVRYGLQELRLTVHKMKEEVDWAEEILALGPRLEEETGIKVKYRLTSLERISKDKLRCIYRFLQEGITNGLKHGKASAFVLTIEKLGELFEITLMDNGSGATSFEKGFGLITMSERIEELGGKLLIETEKGEGFILKMILPGRE